MRGGLYFQSRVEVLAHRAIEHPRLVLDEGWVEGMQVNSVEPGAGERGLPRRPVVFSYGAPRAPATGSTVWMQFEVDPTNVGHRSYGLQLDDETQPLAPSTRADGLP